MSFIDEIVDGYHSAQDMAKYLQQCREEGVELGGSRVPGPVLDMIETQLGQIHHYQRMEQIGHILYSLVHPKQSYNDRLERTYSVLNEVRVI